LPAHSETLKSNLARKLLKRADEIAPRETEADLVRKVADDPVGFAREILGFTPSSAQRRILESARTRRKISIVSGHKVGKSTALAVLALWFYCSFPGARVVLTAATARQVDGIIWREVRRLVRGARIPIPGGDRIHELARSGLTNPAGFEEIRGYTAKQAEAIAGVSGPAIMYLVDEASGVPAAIFEAIEGNRAGGNAWVILISNPTRAEGEFYESQHGRSHEAIGDAGYYAIQIDSRDSPNVTGEWRELEEWDHRAGMWRLRDAPIPGLADPDWIKEKIAEYGEDSAFFKVRVAGQFVVAEESKAFPLSLIAAMQMRYEETEPFGRLRIGVDPAGDGDGGDESGFAARRGNKALEIRARAGLSEQAHLDQVIDLIERYNVPAAAKHGKPVVSIESEGEVGWKVYQFLRNYAQKYERFEVIRVRTSDRAIRQPLIYGTVRDEMWAVARAWGREGGAIPNDSKLEKDLHAPEYKSDIRGRLKLTPKKELKKADRLGRSPDRGDALVISCWEPIRTRDEKPEPGNQGGSGEAPGWDQDSRDEALSPYTDGISPYGD